MTQSHQKHSNHNHTFHMASEGAAREFLRRFFIVTFLLIPLVLLTETAQEFLNIDPVPYRSYLQFGFATAIFYFALVFFEHAKHEIKARQHGMMTLVSLAVAAGYLFSAASTFLPQLHAEFYLEISSLIWVLLFGHYLEAKSSIAAGDALQEVAKLLPQRAHLLKRETGNGKREVQDVNVDELKEGNIVLVKPGEKVPADGVIIKGQANIDESLITGESKPIEKGPNDEVVAGSICTDGSIEVRITRVGENSTIGQIQNLISQAQKSKPRSQALADKAAGWLTFSALGTAILALLVWTFLTTQPFTFAITLAITVLVIACPHALGLAIPTVTTIATSKAVQNGLFIKDLSKLEVIKEIDYVIFDKTGTLTEGKFGVTEIFPINSKFEYRNAKQIPNSNNQISKPNAAQREILQIAGSLEAHSSHVIGQAFIDYTKEHKLSLHEVKDFKNIAGKGVMSYIDGQMYHIGNRTLMEEQEANLAPVENLASEWANEGKTVVFLSRESEIIGLFGLSDVIKEEASAAIDELHEQKIKVAMLTGDSEQVAKSVAQRLNIDSYFAEVLPEDKYKKVRKLQADGNKVMVVGDGVNDAPALTQANVGVAIGAGTDVAVEAGDVVLTRSNPEDVVRLITLSKKVYRKMVENLIWATGYNVLAIPAAAGLFYPLGFVLRPAIGALLMALSSVIVVINALTLRNVKLS